MKPVTSTFATYRIAVCHQEATLRFDCRSTRSQSGAAVSRVCENGLGGWKVLVTMKVKK